VFTRCQACHTVYPVNAALLAQGGGTFRCGKCHKTGNALEALFDEWPQASEQGAGRGEVPELGLALPVAPGQEPAAGQPVANLQRKSNLLRGAWLVSALLLAVVITVSLARFFAPPPVTPQPTPGPDSAAAGPLAPGQAFRALDQIELVSRELKAHPMRPGVLLLTATIVNRATRNQAYPDIEVSLLDIQGGLLARQVFTPADYLSRSAQLRDSMVPQAYLTFSLEMPDPGDEAVGFELQFL
jgi:predicted Zn finger-like uncharacterized protein